MSVQLTPAYLKKLCRDLKLYSSCPELNDILHLQCKGITKIESLDEYTGLRTLYLEQNAIMVIENLDKLVNLRCLYLGRNIIHNITGLENLTNLETVDLSENCISSLKGLEQLTLLRSLTVCRNRLGTSEDIAPLKSLTNLQSLDIAQNKLEEAETIQVLTELPLLYLKAMGNPGVSKIKHYRKHMMVAMPNLNYLDESPCFPKERRLAAAFMEGGLDAERLMREQIRREEYEEAERHRRAFDEMVERARRNPPPPHDPRQFVARELLADTADGSDADADSSRPVAAVDADGLDPSGIAKDATEEEATPSGKAEATAEIEDAVKEHSEVKEVEENASVTSSSSSSPPPSSVLDRFESEAKKSEGLADETSFETQGPEESSIATPTELVANAVVVESSSSVASSSVAETSPSATTEEEGATGGKSDEVSASADGEAEGQKATEKRPGLEKAGSGRDGALSSPLREVMKIAAEEQASAEANSIYDFVEVKLEEEAPPFAASTETTGRGATSEQDTAEQKHEEKEEDDKARPVATSYRRLSTVAEAATVDLPSLGAMAFRASELREQLTAKVAEREARRSNGIQIHDGGESQIQGHPAYSGGRFGDVTEGGGFPVPQQEAYAVSSRTSEAGLADGGESMVTTATAADAARDGEGEGEGGKLCSLGGEPSLSSMSMLSTDSEWQSMDTASLSGTASVASLPNNGHHGGPRQWRSWRPHPMAASLQAAEAARGRSFIWGTSSYGALWEMALRVGDRQQQEGEGDPQEEEEDQTVEQEQQGADVEGVEQQQPAEEVDGADQEEERGQEGQEEHEEEEEEHEEEEEEEQEQHEEEEEQKQQEQQQEGRGEGMAEEEQKQQKEQEKGEDEGGLREGSEGGEGQEQRQGNTEEREGSRDDKSQEVVEKGGGEEEAEVEEGDAALIGQMGEEERADEKEDAKGKEERGGEEDVQDLMKEEEAPNEADGEEGEEVGQKQEEEVREGELKQDASGREDGDGASLAEEEEEEGKEDLGGGVFQEEPSALLGVSPSEIDISLDLSDLGSGHREVKEPPRGVASNKAAPSDGGLVIQNHSLSLKVLDELD